jgi:light-regulated signal transduction histidine kinase (bacteriophytochrome)
VESFSFHDNYERLFFVCPAPMFIHDGEKIVVGNPSFCSMLGFYQVQGMSIPSFVHKECLSSAESAQCQKIVSSDNNIVDVESQEVPILWDGAPCYLVVVRNTNREIETKYLNEVLTRRIEERTTDLTTAREEYERFCYAISHDLRAPLRAISGFSRMIQEDSVLDRKGMEYFQRVQESVSRMDCMIVALMRLSRLSRAPLNFGPVDIGAIAKEAFDQLTIGLQRDIKFTTKSCIARCDPVLIQTLLENLIDNSIKFTKGKENPCIAFGEKESGVYFVSDNGVGFDPRFAVDIFTPFQRFHDRDEFEGEGIGLAIVQRIVTRHGGKILAESEIGKGTTIFFTLAG